VILLRGLLDLLGGDLSRVDRALDSVGGLTFAAEAEHCPECGAATTVYKTKRRQIITLAHGAVEAREIQRECRAPVHTTSIVLRSQRLRETVPPGQRYGYDLIIWVGLLRHRQLLQRHEIRQRVERRLGIRLCDGTLSALCKRFLCFLGALHRAAIPALRREIAESGGYPFHLDATQHQGRGGLAVSLDGWRNWVLHARRIAGERTEELAPLVEATTDWFGDPVAVVRDQGKAVGAAVEPLRTRGVPDLLCHFHVLDNAGKRLLESRHRRIKGRLRALKTIKGLQDLLRRLERRATTCCLELATAVYWVLHDTGKKPLRFPFALQVCDRIERLLALPTHLQRFLGLGARLALTREIDELLELRRAVADDQLITRLLPELRERQRLFDELRAVFRLADPGRPLAPLLPAVARDEQLAVQQRFERYHSELRTRVPATQGHRHQALQTLLDQLDRVDDQLFGHPVVEDSDGRILRVVERTNNPLEQRFGRNARELRRRTGHRHLGKDLEDLPAEALLVHNLDDPRYLRLVAGSLERLPQAFAALQHRPHKPLRTRPHQQIRRRLRKLAPQLPTTHTNQTPNNPLSPTEF
jgi:hypothetical protein